MTGDACIGYVPTADASGSVAGLDLNPPILAIAPCLAFRSPSFIRSLMSLGSSASLDDVLGVPGETTPGTPGLFETTGALAVTPFASASDVLEDPASWAPAGLSHRVSPDSAWKK